MVHNMLVSTSPLEVLGGFKVKAQVSFLLYLGSNCVLTNCTSFVSVVNMFSHHFLLRNSARVSLGSKLWTLVSFLLHFLWLLYMIHQNEYVNCLLTTPDI